MRSQQVALVTGASSGIGQATAELLAARGFTVFGTSRVPASHTRTYQWLPLDVRSEDSVQAAVQSLLEQTGRIDVLVNNAGYALVGAVEESSLAEVQALLETNLLGVIRMIQAVLPVMRQQGSGRIINIGSALGQVAPPYVGMYATSKFAVEGLTEALRDEIGPFGIQVSLVEPAFVKTHLVNQEPITPIAAYSMQRREALQVISAGIQRGIEPGAVAQVVLRAATTTRPRLRYLVGRDAKVLVLLKRLLPEGLFERVRHQVFRAETPPDQQPQTPAQETAVSD